jgi:hypothetical protein
MGGRTFEKIRTVSYKGQTVDELFWSSVEQAQWDHGHAGYTGTIGEKDDYVMRNEGKPVPKHFLNVFMGEDMGMNDKWGPAFCVPVCKSMEDQEIYAYAFYGIASS